MRNAFLFSAVMGFLCFAFYPLAPPRFFPDLGFIDLMAIYSSINYEEPTFQAFYNPYAAMPSLHFGWTLLAGVGAIWIAKHWWTRILGGLLPIAMFLAIVATGNHYLLDAIFGGVVVGIAFGLALLFARWRNNRTSRKLFLPPSNTGEQI